MTLIAAIATLVSGCVVVTSPGGPESRPAARPVWTPEREEREKLPETVGKLEALEAKRGAGGPAPTFADAMDVWQTLAREQTKESSDAQTRVRSRCVLLIGETVREASGIVESALTLSRLGVSLESTTCGAVTPRCSAFLKELEAALPGVVSSSRGLTLRFRAYDVALGWGMCRASLNMVDNFIASERPPRYFALDLFPTAMKKLPDGSVELRIDGTAELQTFHRSELIGKLNVGEAVFDIKRALPDEQSVCPKASLVARLPASDVAALGEKPEFVRVLVDRTLWKPAGAASKTTGVARVLRAGSAPWK
jgi:hypothetical protein